MAFRLNFDPDILVRINAELPHDWQKLPLNAQLVALAPYMRAQTARDAQRSRAA